ncbi:MAG TPA: hypothetical protein PK264_15425 [Hyphomicrobiaceae bacterium]|nr:hypothetical protein [Hyphomicrobiaceae bacterium]
MRLRGHLLPGVVGSTALVSALLAALPAAAQTPQPSVPGITVVPPPAPRPARPSGDGQVAPPSRPSDQPDGAAPRRNEPDDDEGATSSPGGCPFQKKKLELIV